MTPDNKPLKEIMKYRLDIWSSLDIFIDRYEDHLNSILKHGEEVVSFSYQKGLYQTLIKTEVENYGI